MERSSSRVTIYAAIAANVGIAVTKFIAAALTSSSAMLAEGIHSTVDTGDGLLLLLGAWLARRPADARHPFGHGKEVYFWTLIVGILIFAVGGGMSAYEGVRHLLHPHAPRRWGVNMAVIAAAFVFEGASFLVARRQVRRYRRQHRDARGLLASFRQTKDPGVFVVFLEDGAALAGLTIAAIGVTVGHLLATPLADGIASIAIGLLLAVVAVLLAAESRGLLIGESARSRVVTSIRELAARAPGVVRVERVLTMHFGPDEILVMLDVRLDPALDRASLARTSEDLERAIREAHPRVKYVCLELRGLYAAA
jgi:cation diffusion facilitator family transporter